MQVGDLVRRSPTHLKVGIIVDVEATGDYVGIERFLVKWLDMSGSQWYLGAYLEVLGESR